MSSLSAASAALLRRGTSVARHRQGRHPPSGDLLRAAATDARIATMTGGDSVTDCFVCRKHRDRGPLLPGGAVAEDDLVVVSHVVTPEVLGRDGTTAYLGHLFVEPLRHAPGLADLTDAEARRV